MPLENLTWTPNKSGGLTGRSATHVASVWKQKDVYRWAVMCPSNKHATGMGVRSTQEEAIEAANQVAIS